MKKADTEQNRQMTDSDLTLQTEPRQRKNPLKVQIFIAVCVCIMLCGFFTVWFLTHRVELHINIITKQLMDMRSLNVESIKYSGESDEVFAEGKALFEENTGLSYDKFTENMPNDESLWYTVYYRMNENGETDKRPHDFIFSYDRKDAYCVQAAVSPIEKPIRAHVYENESTEISYIDGTELVIFAYLGNGSNGSYYADFQKDGLYYYVCCDDVTEETLVEILREYLKKS